MPVAAKFSKQFYDQLGHHIVDELVNWINDVDATYRADLRELNELNFARFDATMEQRFAEQDAKIERRFAEQDAKFEKRFAEQDAKFEKRFAEFDRRFAGLEVRMERGFAQADASLQRAMRDQTRWMFGVWAALLIPIIGLWMRG